MVSIEIFCAQNLGASAVKVGFKMGIALVRSDLVSYRHVGVCFHCIIITPVAKLVGYKSFHVPILVYLLS